MCFSPKTPTVTPTPPPPTTATTGATEATTAENLKQRKAMTSASGYSQNILSGQPVTQPTTQKTLLG